MELTKEEYFNKLNILSVNQLYLEQDRTTLNIYHEEDEDNYEYGVVKNFVDDENVYEIFMFVVSNESIVPRIQIKYIQDKTEANEKFKEYKALIKKKKIKKILDYFNK